MIMKIFLFDDNKSINTYIVRIRIVEHISTLWKETLSAKRVSFLFLKNLRNILIAEQPLP